VPRRDVRSIVLSLITSLASRSQIDAMFRQLSR
jgi:hypothetical protein